MATKNSTSYDAAREHQFFFTLPADDLQWLAFEVARRLTTAQRILVLALHGVRHGGSDLLSELLTSEKTNRRARKVPTAGAKSKRIVVHLSDDEARWVFVEAAKRFTTAPKMLPLIVRGIREGGSPLLSELMASPPPADPAPLATPNEETRPEVRLPISDATWFHVQAAAHQVNASQLLVRVLEDLRAGGTSLVPTLSEEGDLRGKARPPLTEPTRRLSCGLSPDDSRWLNVACGERLLTTQELLALLVRGLRLGGTDFVRDLAHRPKQPRPRSAKSPA